MNKAIDFFVKNKTVTGFILIIILLTGFLSFKNLKQEVFPPTDINTMIIEILYPGASPRDSEINAVIPIEDKLSSVPGIKSTVSLSVENGGTVYVYLDPDVKDLKSVKDQIYRDISLSTEGISEDVEKISIIDINPKRMAVYSLAISYDDAEKLSEKDFYSYSEDIENKLKNIKGVGEVRVSGYKEREIKIKVNPFKLQSDYVSLNEITNSIQNRNVRVTGGSLQSVQKEHNIVTIGEFENPLEVENVIIRSTFEHPSLRISNIAEVEDSFKKQAVMVRVNKKPGITFSIVKKENSDIVKTVDNLKLFIEKEKKNVPDGLTLTAVEDRSLSIRSLLNVVASNAVIGFLLVFIILLFFLDYKTAFWTAFGIPTTLLMLFTFFNLMDYSLNLITLGAVITVLGMLVDHGIVISESVFSFKNQGFSTAEAAVKGVADVISPVLITILTTIAAFLPLLYVGGIMGKFIKVYPVIISAALILSFLEAVFILPGHLAHIKDGKKKIPKKRFEIFAEGYKKLLMKLFSFRYAVFVFFIFLLGLSLFLAKDNIKNFVLMWDNTADSFLINLEAPEGTPLGKTSELTVPLEELLNKAVKKNELYAVKTNIGHHTVKRVNSQGNHENWAQIEVYLVPQTERERSVEQIINAVKNEFKEQKDTVKKFNKITFSKMTVGPSSSGQVEMKITGGNTEDKTAVFNKINGFMKELPGVIDLDNDQKPGKDELKIIFNYEALAKLDLNVASVAQSVKTAYDGNVATSIQTENEKIDFRVLIDDKYKRDINFLENLLIPNAKGRLIKLNQVAEIETGTGPAIINHFNGNRVITITSRVNKDLTTANTVSAQVTDFFSSIPDKNKDVKLIIKGEAEDTQESLADLRYSFILALILIYFLLLLLFKKAEQPLIVLITIPFGIIGVLLAFYFHGIPLSFMALVGIIGLSGVVVNDSVVMVAFINKLMVTDSRSIENLKEGIAEGAKQRLRPIILTTLTTVAGLLPSVYGIGGDVQSLVPVVMALSYGLIFATLVTLFLVPALFLIIRDIKGIFIRTAG